MCDLCSEGEERKKAQERYVNYSDQLLRLSRQFQSLASGRINPHSDEAKAIALGSRAVVRFLVEDWI